MRYTPIGQATQPILLRAQQPVRNPINAYYAAEGARGQNYSLGM
jgi:hypothetical protein